MNAKRVFVSAVLAIAAVSAFGLVILYLDVRPQLNELEAYDSSHPTLVTNYSSCEGPGWKLDEVVIYLTQVTALAETCLPIARMGGGPP